MYRAKRVLIAALLASLALAFVPHGAVAECRRVGPAQVGSCPSGASGSGSSSPSSSGSAAQFLSRINTERAKRGRGRLGRNYQLESIASAHAKRMAAAGRIYHNEELFAPETVAALGDPDELGENVGRGRSVAELHDSFMRSASHRANILERAYGTSGIAVVSASGQLWVVETFMSPVRRAGGRIYTERYARQEVAGQPILAGPAIGAWRYVRPQSVAAAVPDASESEVLGVRETLKHVPGGAAGIVFVMAFTVVLGAVIPRRREDTEYV